MEEVRGVLCLNAQRVQGDVLIIVFVMVEARDANLKGVAKVHKAAQISARHMVEGRDAPGAILGQNMATNLLVLVTLLQGVRQVSVHSTAALFRIRGFMGVQLLGLLSKTLNLANLRR